VTKIALVREGAQRWAAKINAPEPRSLESIDPEAVCLALTAALLLNRRLFLVSEYNLETLFGSVVVSGEAESDEQLVRLY
jgi:hypothetical protein